jgi:hypothetical protein
MIVGLVQYACIMINMFPKTNTVGGMARRELFTRVRVDYERDCKLGFGEYVQAYAEESISNTMQPRTFGAISFETTGNLQGTYMFLSLSTWKVVRRRTWIEMPIPDEVIELINRKAIQNISVPVDTAETDDISSHDEEMERRSTSLIYLPQ